MTTNNKTSNSQSLKEFVSKIKDLKSEINIELNGNVADIIVNPKSWAESIAEQMVAANADKIIKARQLGEQFGKEISTDKS